MTYICGAGSAPDQVLGRLATLTGCCVGAMEDGPTSCTCWEAIYDHAEQLLPDVTITPVDRAKMCDDCAFKPDSPERTGSDEYAHSDPGVLENLSAPFWCHQGMRKPIAYRHPCGITVEVADVDHYDPPVINGVPFKGDGTPGDRCAGWAARQRATASV